jgi:hypothetical protein
LGGVNQENATFTTRQRHVDLVIGDAVSQAAEINGYIAGDRQTLGITDGVTRVAGPGLNLSEARGRDKQRNATRGF